MGWGVVGDDQTHHYQPHGNPVETTDGLWGMKRPKGLFYYLFLGKRTGLLVWEWGSAFLCNASLGNTTIEREVKVERNN